MDPGLLECSGQRCHPSVPTNGRDVPWICCGRLHAGKTFQMPAVPAALVAQEAPVAAAVKAVPSTKMNLPCSSPVLTAKTVPPAEVASVVTT